MKKRFKAINPLILLLAFMLVLSACGGDNAKPTSNSGGGSSGGQSSGNGGGGGSSAEQVTISFLHWRTEDKEVFDKLIADFEAKNPDIKVTQTIFPSSDYTSIAQQKLLDGSTGDVFTVFPGSQFEALHKAGLMEDLTGKPVVDRFVPNLITKGAKDGKQYALPYHLVYNNPLINVDIFEKLNIERPRTWSQYLAALETLKQGGYIPIAFPGADIGQGQLMNPMLMNENTDEEMFPKLLTGETKLTDEWFVNSLRKWQQLAPYFQPNSLGTNYEAAVTLFVTEQAAILATGSFHAALVLNQAPDMRLDMLPPITVEDESQIVYEGVHNTTFMLAINTKSAKKEAAEKFLEFLAEKETAEYYANNTGQLGVVRGLEYSSKSLQFETDFTALNTRFLPRSTIPDKQIEDAITGSISAVISGTSPEEAAADAQKIVDQVRNQ
jgi:raffinose/stachyose/melibiose transport system substrate-binding protein